MTTTAFISMWISDTSTTALMVPIIEAVMKNIRHQSEAIDCDNNNKCKFVSKFSMTFTDKHQKNFWLLFMGNIFTAENFGYLSCVNFDHKSDAICLTVLDTVQLFCRSFPMLTKNRLNFINKTELELRAIIQFVYSTWAQHWVEFASTELALKHFWVRVERKTHKNIEFVLQLIAFKV